MWPTPPSRRLAQPRHFAVGLAAAAVVVSVVVAGAVWPADAAGAAGRVAVSAAGLTAADGAGDDGGGGCGCEGG